jgi:hypothetical protein
VTTAAYTADLTAVLIVDPCNGLMSKVGKLYEAIDKQGRGWVFLEPQYLAEINQSVRNLRAMTSPWR